MPESGDYSINLDPQFDFLELIDVPSLVAACDVSWYNQTLCKVNELVVRMGVMGGEFHWHKHDEEDEFFLVLNGRFIIDFEDHTVTLERHQGIAVPRGVVHRTRAPIRSAILMVERSTVQPLGDQ